MVCMGHNFSSFTPQFDAFLLHSFMSFFVYPYTGKTKDEMVVIDVKVPICHMTIYNYSTKFT